MTLYSLYDCKADSFTPPFLAKNEELAKRTILQAFAQVGECQLTQYPEDFTLFAVASWDEDTGTIEPLPCKVSAGTVLQIVTAFKRAQADTKKEEE